MDRSVLKSLLREPLFHFLLIGGALFLLGGRPGGSASAPGRPGGPPSAHITVTADDAARLADQFTRTWQRPPTEPERQGLIDDFIRNEIWYREAVALGLDRDDAVLQRRLRQKMEFIYEDIGALAEPTDEVLRAFAEEHPGKYAAEPQVSFSQVAIGTDRWGTGAEAEALRVLARLRAGANPDAIAEASMLAPELERAPLSEIVTQFGGEFGKSLLALPPGQWAGPVESSYGLHLVLVRERADAHLPAWDEISAAVRQDWTAAKQQEVKDAAYAKLRERYTVTIEEPEVSDTTTPPVAAAEGSTR